jgi:glycerol-3-phosphate dehydrogenase
LAQAVVGMIVRDPTGAAGERWDLLIIGGGIYGVTLALEAAHEGLRPLLVERDDFGQHTSWNSLRIVHGGFRYLQTLDLPRFQESVTERRWFLKNFPEHVRPLACLLPLYGRGLRRPPILAVALRLNDTLTMRRNDGVQTDRHLPAGRVLTAEETESIFPLVRRAGLRGGAQWWDAGMEDSQRLLIEVLRWAVAQGACALNYVEARELRLEGGRVTGIEARDAVSGATLSLRADTVVNCAGPWCRELAQRFDRNDPALFRPSLAFNVLLDREPPATTHAVAVEPPRRGARTYFLHPWKGRLLAGTFHAPRPGGFDQGAPEAELIHRLLADLSAAMPEARPLAESEVRRVLWGLLPAAADGVDDLAVRERIVDHARRGGPRGLYSVSGVKFTTARRVAEKTLARIRGGRPRSRSPFPPRGEPPAGTSWEEMRELLASDPAAARDIARRIAREEAVVRVEDLLLRRTDWGLHPEAPADLERTVEELLG